jgi:hypothetical protein
MIRNQRRFTNSREMFDRGLCKMKMRIATLFLLTCATLGLVAAAKAGPIAAIPDRAFVTAQAMLPPSGIGDAGTGLAAANMAAEDRMKRRFPQTVRVGDLIGLPVLDDGERTLGYVRQVVRTQDKIKLIVGYSRWFGWLGWNARPVAVPVEALGIFGRNIASLDMPRNDYVTAPTWGGGGTALSNDDNIRIALAKH